MEVVNLIKDKGNLSQLVDDMNCSGDPRLIVSRNGNPAVLISFDDWNSIQETLYVMWNPKNRKAITEEVDLSECLDQKEMDALPSE
jgi:antitoxin YefM